MKTITGNEIYSKVNEIIAHTTSDDFEKSVQPHLDREYFDSKQGYLHVAIEEVNLYIDFLKKSWEDLEMSDEQISKNHEAYRKYVNDVRNRCGKSKIWVDNKDD